MDDNTPFTQDAWNKLVLPHAGSFLQSFEWGKLQQVYGRAVFRCFFEGVFAQCISIPLPLGFSYLYVPRGPLSTHAHVSPRALRQFFASVKQAAKDTRPVFLRVDPPRGELPLQKLGFVDAGRSIQPRMQWVVDLRDSEEDILAGMHQKTRYNIRLAGRKGVAVRWGAAREQEQGEGLAAPFFSLLEETANRQEIRLHPRPYYQAFWRVLPLLTPHAHAPLSRAVYRLYIASFADEDVVAALVFYFGRRAVYLHGGSSNKHRKVMPSHLLHWRVMQDAKALGCEAYDMGGIDPKRWQGLTRFKQGFGGRREAYGNAWELPFSRIGYTGYRAARALLRR